MSLVVITRNEEANLRRCLDSANFVDEIVVVDSGSTDRTVEIARSYTNKVYCRPLEGFGVQKQFAVDKADGEWLLSLDADEWISEKLRASLLRLLREEDGINTPVGYRIFRRNIYLGRPMYYCGWYIPLLRLFRRSHGRFNDKLVHEEIVVDGKVAVLDGDIMHEPYRDLTHHLAKVRLYATLDAKELVHKGRKVYGWQAPIHLLMRPAYKFIEKYILQQGFREGWRGALLSTVAAWGVFLMHFKCLELQRREAQQ